MLRHPGRGHKMAELQFPKILQLKMQTMDLVRAYQIVYLKINKISWWCQASRKVRGS